nr:venom polypeptide precursor [Doratifera vulnerans]
MNKIWFLLFLMSVIGMVYSDGVVECPAQEDGTKRFSCPTKDAQERYRCIDDYQLCDGAQDCPNGEDENRMGCMFYNSVKANLDVLADGLLQIMPRT